LEIFALPFAKIIKLIDQSCGFEQLRETDAELGRSSRIINSMIARSIQHRVILFVVGVVIAGAIVYALYAAIAN
jgi:hypothetical protein